MSWIDRLITAVDADNEGTSVRCDSAQTVAVLRDAPAWAQEHAKLALTDFAAAGARPLTELHSTTVARRFEVQSGPGALNVLVARLLVPGGPWPGHFGLEAIVFTARETTPPSWFPPHRRAHDPLTFAESVGSSAAFRRGHGSVIFPELLAVSEVPDTQSFGIVLVDRLERLFADHVTEPARALGWLRPAGTATTDGPRELAFLAHEWGHRATDDRYTEHVTSHRRRLSAVLSEIAADVFALDMLSGVDHPSAPDVAQTLVMDRILREAWLARPDEHVASIVARHLLQFLAYNGVLGMGPSGPLLDLDAAPQLLSREIAALDEVYGVGEDDRDGATAAYLERYGWTVVDGRLSLATPVPVAAEIESYVQPEAGISL